MALAALTPVGAIIATAMGTPDPAAIAAWSGVCGVLAVWLPANCVVLPGLMVAAGAAVSGLGVITISGSAADLGLQLALAAGSPPTDAAAIAKWTQIAGHIITDFTTNIKVNGSTLVAVPTGGPITGTALLTLTAPLLSVLFATMATDAAGIAAFALFGSILEAQIILLGQMIPLPIGMASPSGGGPLTGTGTIL